MTVVVPPKPLFNRIRPVLSRIGFEWERWDLPHLYRLAPLHIARDCHPLVDPPFVPASKANHMREEDDLIGLSLDGDTRAYPWWVLDNHHVANDVVGGHPVVVSLCEMCSSGIAFSSVVDGRRLTFRTTHVYLGTTAIEDRQTRSLWSTYFGRSIAGPLRGTKLQLLPAQQMQWGAWRQLHPDTLVLPGYLGTREGHGAGHTLGSGELSPDMSRTVPRWDDRLPHNTLILGVLHGGRQKGYPISVLRHHRGVLNDEMAGQPIVALAHMAENSSGALAFSRVVDGETLTFVPGGQHAIDMQSGSQWTVEGLSVEGPLRGRRLSFIESHVSEWFVWVAHFPDIELVMNGLGPDPSGETEGKEER